ncbi:hypothetical protein LMH87_006502 [Akanthomyces muscarius]|uniref:Uncharacterized protein n=1 Tax=Akanthomyces muscarius TaxID=2231603 RepID=A0A9W8QR07_AKAMU|nr:hypothetical protein LMH87_006502 [Akanthomyces muscarius]KAJ4164847.1 hypothetical protein LMH87_006502 [Akanthomyces muscarius]
MAGKRGKKTANSSSPQPASTSQSTAILVQSTSGAASNPILGYKLRVLIHDLLHVTKDPAAAHRLNSTTDEYYISAPYFTPEEAATMQNVTLDSLPNLDHVPGRGDQDLSAADLVSKPVHEALGILLSGFLDKRRASGDARPCGPHHLAPLYAALFSVELSELQDAKFLGRLRRNGL